MADIETDKPSLGRPSWTTLRIARYVSAYAGIVGYFIATYIAIQYDFLFLPLIFIIPVCIVAQYFLRNAYYDEQINLGHFQAFGFKKPAAVEIQRMLPGVAFIALGAFIGMRGQVHGYVIGVVGMLPIIQALLARESRVIVSESGIFCDGPKEWYYRWHKLKGLSLSEKTISLGGWTNNFLIDTENLPEKSLQELVKIINMKTEHLPRKYVYQDGNVHVVPRQFQINS